MFVVSGLTSRGSFFPDGRYAIFWMSSRSAPYFQFGVGAAVALIAAEELYSLAKHGQTSWAAHH